MDAVQLASQEETPEMAEPHRQARWEPDEARGSRPVLRGGEGAIPSLYSLGLTVLFEISVMG